MYHKTNNIIDYIKIHIPSRNLEVVSLHAKPLGYSAIWDMKLNKTRLPESLLNYIKILGYVMLSYMF